jgi:hypothetical protein
MLSCSMRLDGPPQSMRFFSATIEPDAGYHPYQLHRSRL